MSEEKKAVRKRILKCRDALSLEQRDNDSGTIADMLFVHPKVMSASSLLLFANFGSEVCTDIIAMKGAELGKKLFYPLVCGDEIRFFEVQSHKDLKPGYRGIREPVYAAPWKADEEESVVLVPGVAFDISGGRIGYGGGFYDRFLKTHEKLYKIGICFACQLVEKLPQEEWDAGVDLVIYGI